MEKDQYNPFVISHCKRSPTLEEKFRQFNRDFFNSTLQRYRVLLCTKCKSFGHEMCGYCISGRRKRGMILIRAGMKERSTEQTLIHEMVHAKLFWIRKEIHGKRFISELRRLRKLGAPLSSLELDKVRSDSVTSREPARLTKKRVCSLIFEALTNEGLTAMALPRYLEQELMVPYSVINSSVDVKREAKKLTELIKKNQSTVHNACF